MKSPIVLLRHLLNDIGRLQPDVKGLNRDFLTIKLRFKHEGIGFLTIALPSFCDSLNEGLSEGQFRCPLGFKRAKGSSLPAFLLGLTSKVFDNGTGLLRKDSSVESVQSLRQILLFFKKLSLHDDEVERLHNQAADRFFLDDDLNGQKYFSDREDHLLGIVSSYVLPDLCSIKLEEIEARHGPGAVAESLSTNRKWVGLYQAICDDTFDTELYGYDYVGLIDRIDLSIRPDPPTNRVTQLFDSTMGASRGVAKLVTVAKNSTSRRTITIEPLMKQFLQQGLNNYIRRSIDKCSILRNCLALTDQTANQKLALEGSKSAYWATLDLKSASDLLSLRLVKSVFRHRPQFLEACLMSRTPKVSFNGVERSIGKYAGMGNATTFPIQSVVFAVIAIAAIVDTSGFRPTFWSVKRASRCIRVFGDDIIVKTEYVQKVVDWLHHAGLIVNMKKSFLKGNFRESCGVDAYHGVDVTPVYCRNHPVFSSTDASALAAHVSLSNSLWMRGYYSAACWLKEHVERVLGRTLPLVSSNSQALGWHSRVDAMTAHRWDYVNQRLVTESLVIRPLKRKDELSGYPALLKFFHTPLLGRDVDHLKRTSVRFKLKIAKKRVPTHVG